MIMSSIFSKIIAGEIPCHKVYEDENVLAFLDISPVCVGHCLVIPKKEVENIGELDDITAANLMIGIKKTSDILIKSLGAEGINIFNSNGEVAGQTVMHLHFHLLPRYSEDCLKTNIHENPVLDIDLNEVKSRILNS